MVFIDEISMVGADKFQRVHESLSNMQNKKKGKPFGGVSVICFGDLKQVYFAKIHIYYKNKFTLSFLP